MYHFYSLPKIVSNYVRKRPPAWPEWLLSVGLQGCREMLLPVRGRGCRGKWVDVGGLNLGRTNQIVAGEQTLLVSVMSGQSIGADGGTGIGTGEKRHPLSVSKTSGHV